MCEVQDAEKNAPLINGFTQILNVLHEINGAICQTLRGLSVRENADKLQNDLILS